MPRPDQIRDRCYTCYRPRDGCFCDLIPRVENLTDVVILQHRRERFHAFNTARIVHKALVRSTLLVDHNKRLAEAAGKLPISNRSGILYPSPDARLLSDLTPEERPHQMFVIDGTWQQAKTLMRDIPMLQELPRFRLNPSEPSRYRIRREPTMTALSTVEATVQALQWLEPDTTGLQQLLAAFETMVDRQLAIPKPEQHWRKNLRRRGAPNPNVPKVLMGDTKRIVVAYGERSPLDLADTASPPSDSTPPIFWNAKRLGTDQSLRMVIRNDEDFDENDYRYLNLTPDDFASAVSIAEFRKAWSQFIGADDSLVVYHSRTAQLLSEAGMDLPHCLTLKSVQWQGIRPAGTLEAILQQLGLQASEERTSRGDERLENAIRLVEYLRQANA